MPRNGSGTYERAVADYLTGEIAEADGETGLNTEMDDIAAALTGSLARDGQTPLSGDLDADGYSITGLRASAEAGEAVRHEQLEGYTPVDAAITALAGLEYEAGEVIRATGPDTFTLDPTSAFGRGLWAAADLAAYVTALGGASAARTAFGLAIGSDVQAYDADTAKLDVAQTWSAAQSFGNAAGRLKMGEPTGLAAVATPANIQSGISSANLWAATNAATTSFRAHWALENPNGVIAQIGTSGDDLRIDLDDMLDLNGDLDVSGTITASSDARLKEGVQPIGDASAIVAALRGYRFSWRDGRAPGRQIGLIAQEVAAVAPELVREDGEGFLSVAYGNAVALLIEDNNALRARIARLERLIEARP